MVFFFWQLLPLNKYDDNGPCDRRHSDWIKSPERISRKKKEKRRRVLMPEKERVRQVFAQQEAFKTSWREPLDEATPERRLATLFVMWARALKRNCRALFFSFFFSVSLGLSSKGHFIKSAAVPRVRGGNLLRTLLELPNGFVLFTFRLPFGWCLLATFNIKWLIVSFAPLLPRFSLEYPLVSGFCCSCSYGLSYSFPVVCFVRPSASLPISVVFHGDRYFQTWVASRNVVLFVYRISHASTHTQTR